jgi:1,4-dihydroxy-2-naphthoate octaprenyltransferase
LKAYLGVARANFLLLPVTLVAVGAAAAAYDGDFDPLASLAALIGMLALHVSVNALNEYSDFRSGIDLATERTPFSGGSGTLPTGALPARAALLVGVAGAAIGLLIGLGFLYLVGWPLVPIFCLGAACVLAYSGLLARAYLGELAAGLGLGTLPVLGTALVQGGGLGAAAMAASLPPFFMTFNLLLLNEVPDEAPDRRGGRRNMVHLLGRAGAARLYVVMGWLVPICLAGALLAGALPVICLLAILPSVWLIPPSRWALTRAREPVPIVSLGANVIWNLATNTVLALCLWLAAAIAAGRIDF